MSENGGQATGTELSSITVAMVQLHRRFYGKGPTEAKTYAVNDTILCMLKGGFTTVEKTLMADGKIDEVEHEPLAVGQPRSFTRDPARFGGRRRADRGWRCRGEFGFPQEIRSRT